jgi:D-lyxose ketol-isomerase
MNELFTVEEINLMCIFDTGSKAALVAELTAAMAEFEDEELAEIAENVLARLNSISEAEFAALELCPEYEEYDDELEV